MGKSLGESSLDFSPGSPPDTSLDSSSRMRRRCRDRAVRAGFYAARGFRPHGPAEQVPAHSAPTRRDDPFVMSRGAIIAAPGSGSGKTTLTLALLRALRDAGVAVTSAKVGPDYIDPAYHAAASGRVCHNLDTWSMTDRTIAALLADLQRDAYAILVEGVMGLFDGAPDGRGSAADLSRRTGWPVVLVVDASGMAASVAALVHGFMSYDSGVEIAGVIFNRTGSHRHGELLRRATRPLGVPVFGCVTRSDCLSLPDRHLGLVQAREHPDLESFLARAARQIRREVDTEALLAAAGPARLARTARTARPARPTCPTRSTRSPPVAPSAAAAGLPMLGQRTAVARDDAFAFCYPHMLDGWRRAGCEIGFFSPLEDEPPPEHVDAVFLPGGYPELHAARLAAAGRFKAGLARCAERGAVVYGECGGYMVLGERLVDGDGVSHRMVGLLPVETSFESPRLSLGYREVALVGDSVLGHAGTRFRGHEFHFASIVAQSPSGPLFRTFDAELQPLGDTGLRLGNVMGSFVHLMDRHGA